MFSTSNLNEDEAELIADAYFRGEKDPARMARLLGVDSFDLNLIMHPLVRRYITSRQVQLNRTYSIEDHLTKLKEIRDGALDNENYKIALQAEVSLGKAAGLYEAKPIDDPNAVPGQVDPSKLSTDDLRKRLANMIGAALPAPKKDEDDVTAELHQDRAGLFSGEDNLA